MKFKKYFLKEINYDRFLKRHNNMFSSFHYENSLKLQETYIVNITFNL